MRRSGIGGLIGRSGLVAGVALALVTPPVAASDPDVVGKQATIDLSEPTRIGLAVLAPGRYRLQHRPDDGRHYLIVFSRRHGRDVEVAHVPCEVVPSIIRTPLAVDALYTADDADGVMAITAVHIKGEKHLHVVTLGPAPCVAGTCWARWVTSRAATVVSLTNVRSPWHLQLAGVTGSSLTTSAIRAVPGAALAPRDGHSSFPLFHDPTHW